MDKKNKKNKKHREREMAPVLKSEEGSFDPREPKDNKKTYLVERSHIYDKYEKEVVAVRDISVIILYICFLLIILISAWIKMEKGEFPFNVGILADITYSRKHANGALLVLLGISLLSILSYLVKSKIFSFFTDNMSAGLESELKRGGNLKHIKTV